MKTCSEGCGSPVWARGYCSRHYAAAKATGDLAKAPRERNPFGMGSLHKPTGYRFVTVDGKRRKEHVVIAEKALGRALPEGAQVHHVNEVRDDNRPGNLVVCPDQAYHQLLHVRMAALKESGNPDWRRCTYCQKHDDPSRLSFASSGKDNASPKVYHLECRAAYRRAAYAKAA